ncbi:sorbosone dehydrogenase family protein [Rhodopseudomonas palustris]|uniref:PQQ-dependent sugar dehydrogenase n=1 Tax=Rhodopseudomonas palustris TaxID=1076 RepID=UPI002ACD308F|nr:sorbosone dehydrogenase family protein [Rhodopseudomonas palustris]WQG98290.1 sorbosone dehydrogenase family protein [Rhodopseudomonas palustris]
MPRPFTTSRLAICVAMVLPLAACGDQASLTQGEDYGPTPKLAEPSNNLLPTVNIAPAVGWAQGAKPKPAEGMAVTAFATGLDHPRTLHVLPNGDVLVAETNAPERPEQGKGLKRMVAEFVMGQAGAKTPSANRITLLRDADGDGVAEVRSTFIDGLNSPFGMALVGNELYVANTDAIMRFPYNPGDTRITTAGEKLADLPAGPRNHHWTKDLIASRDGTKLYATSGSNSNAAEHGMDEEINRAAVLEIDRATGATRLFASGLRNPNGPAFEPETGALWVVVNERDEIGSDLVPDYMTSVQDGGFYGWPYSWFGQHVDTRVEPPRPDLVAKAIVPDYALGNHTASLGLAFNTGELFPADMKGGAFVGQHGSWNRKPHSGYKVIYVPFEGGKPSGPPRDILTGFLNDKEEAQGRPVGVAIDGRGALLVADDVGNSIWRVTPAGREQAAR